MPPSKPPAVAAQTPEEVERKTKAILDEYLSNHELEEAVLCVREIEPASIHLFVYHIINNVLERTQKGRELVGNLLHDLVKKQVLTVDQYLQGLVDILEFAEDMEIDIPRIWKYMGEIIGPMVQDGSVPLDFLRDAVKPVGRKAGLLIAEVLHVAAEKLGHVAVGQQWQQSGLVWEEFLGKDQDLSDFIKRNKLEFTLNQEPKSPDGKNLSAERVQQELDRLIVTQDVETPDIIDWITRNVGEAHVKEATFVRALVTSVCSSSIEGNQVNTDKLKRRTNLIQRYIDHNDDLELQALYAVQSLVHKLEHPAGVLRSFFDMLYDEEIISEEAFYAWEQSTDPAEMAGKGVATNSVKQFFTWLQNADEVADN